MRTLKLLRHLIITLTQMIPVLRSSPAFSQKRSLHLYPAVVKCFTVFFMTLLFVSGNVFAQTESIDASKWISPDIPRGIEARPVAGRPTAGLQTLAVPSSANPDIPQSLLCQDLKVVFVLDESGSIAGSEITSVENGALALANALLNSGATLQLVEFSTTSSIVNLGITQVNSTYISRLTSYLGAGYNGQNYNPVSANPCTGWTNWQDAMDDVATLNADLVIFFTDGNPTAYNVASGGNCSGGIVNAGNSATLSLDNAVTQANVVKGQGKHIFVVGVGNSNEINLDNIKAISGNDAFGPAHDILTADYTTPPFEALATNLTAAVNSICGTELLVDKTASNSGVCSGQSVIFTNKVTNTGGDFNFTALSVVAKDVYPNGYSNLQFVPSAPAGASISGNTVTYNIGDMAAGQSVIYQIKATVLVPVPVKNYNNVIAATAFNANEVKDSASVLSGFATAQIDTTSCVPVVINGVTYSSTNTYTQTLVSAAGCDSILTIKLTIAAPTTSTETVTQCDSYTWPLNGTTYTQSGSYTSSATSAAGCVHTTTLNLTINKSTSKTTAITECDSYTWGVNGVTYTESGTYSVNSTNAAGCPHTETLELTINKSTSNTVEAAACDSYSWAESGITYYQSGTYTVESTNASGCPHTETLILTINESTSNVITASACDSYVWSVNGQTYTESGFYTSVSVNAAGCPYTEALSLTITHSTESSSSETACDSYTWPVNGTTYTESGTYTASTTNGEGCTHTETLYLTINKSTSNTVTETACDSYTWGINGVTYTESGTYTVNSTNASGCPHTETLELTINKSTSNTVEAAACDSYSWAESGITYYQSGTYTVESTNAAGCPHTETLILTINESTSNVTTASACDSYVWSVNGQTYTESGFYTSVSVNAAGCPYTEALSLTIGHNTENSSSETACDSYTWPVDGNTYTESGTYTATSTVGEGCIHTETLYLTINKSTSNTVTETACDSYTWGLNGVTYTESGTYLFNSTNASGCPHTETLELTINKSSSNTTAINACGSYTWAVNGVTYTAGGTYTATSTNASGCPHTEKLVLTLNAGSSNSTPVTACDSYKWAVNGTTYTESGTYTVTSTNAAGCPHTEKLVLTINKSTSKSTSVTACDSYKWPANGVTYITGGTYNVISTNAAGCPHTETLVLTINKSTSNTTTTSACGSYKWPANGTTYTQSGTYTVTSTNASGCPHTEKLVLTINNGATTTTTKTACDSYTWPVNGVTYTQSGTYTVTTAGSYGCNGIQKLVLTINKSTSKTTTIAVCNSYKWPANGVTYTQSGTYYHSSTNASGCTCTEQLVLTINKVPVVGAISGPVKVCRKQTVQYSVAAVSNAASYTWVLPSGITGTSTTNVITVTIGAAFTTGTIQVRANNACGSCAYSQIGVTAVTAVPSACGNITGSRVFCATGNLNYSIPAVANATSYLWTVTGTGLSIVSGQGTTGITVAATSAFVSGTISVKAVNCLGSCVPVTIAVSASKTPAKPGPISGPVTGLCKKSNITYSVPAVPGATSYTWTVPSGATIISGAGTNTIKVTFGPALTGAGNISVTANNACGSSPACSLAVIMVPAAPVASGGSLSVNKTQSAVVYSVTAVPDAVSYTWTISGGAKFVGSTTGNSVTVNFTTATSTTAVITAKANNACGSSAAGTATIAVSLGTTGGYARGVSGSTLIDEITAKASNYAVYPNPNKGQFDISFNTKKLDKVAVILTDLTGRVVYNTLATYEEGAQVKKVNISRFAKGAYLVRIVRNNEQEKIVKVFVD